MAGSISLSLTQRYDKTSHEPLDGGILRFYAAGTTTPQNAFQDISLTIPWENPMTLDSGGNVPQLFFADGYIKFTLTNSAGVTQISADYVLVMGPTAGAGAAPSVDATTILSAGDLKVRYGTGIHTGFVRANGRTIGSGSSGASERANTDCEDLFLHLWTEDANLTVSTGRGASAAADWAANKTIALPDWRGRALAALDDMGSTTAGRLSLTYFGATATTLGAAGGSESTTMVQANLPDVTLETLSSQAVKGSTINLTIDGSSTPHPNVMIDTGATVSFSTELGGVATPMRTAMPAMLATIYMKL
jgi:hypothetical protein